MADDDTRNHALALVALLSNVQSVDQWMRLGMRCRLSPTADVPSHTSGAAMCPRSGQFISPLRSSYCTGTGRSNSGLKNRLPRAAKMIGVNPITAA